ncbi:MAG: mevalonate kinase [Myxococcota bacterium]
MKLCGNTVEASAPGSMMLLGEHAVLAGKRALVAAVAPRVHVRLSPRKDNALTVTSAVGNAETSIENLHLPTSLRFVHCALRLHADRFPTGCDLHIHSDLSHTQGLGSSAAVTVATLGAVRHWLRLPTHTDCMLQEGVAAVRQAQNGLGSGADVAASVAGGLLAFGCVPCPNIVCRFDHFPPIVVLYSGHKTPTPQVIAHMQKNSAMAQDLSPGNLPSQQRTQCIHIAMDNLVTQALPVCRQQQWSQLGHLLNQGHELLADLGVSTPLLDKMANALRTQPTIWGAKISGAGLGDSVLAVGSSEKTDWPWEQVNTHITPQGFYVESLHSP